MKAKPEENKIRQKFALVLQLMRYVLSIPEINNHKYIWLRNLSEKLSM